MDIFRTTITKSPQETTRLGEEFGSLIVKSQSFGKTQDDPEQSRTGRKSKVKSGQDRGALTVCLYGDLGSGKTTFVQGVGKAFGIASRLLSPTFIIVRRYPVPEQTGFLYHIDLYRMEGEKDLLGLGLPEIFADTDSIILVEWAEKLGDLLPKERVDVRLNALDDGSHSIWISSSKR